MEIHRLTPMKSDYPVDLFNELHKETKQLRKTLSYQIDARRYGVTRDIIESWFDDKFLFVFNKHFQNMEREILKATLINSLRNFKMRILRKAYSEEGEFYNTSVTLDGEFDLINTIRDDREFDDDNRSKLLDDYMRKHLSDNAYIIFRIQIDVPPYITSRLANNNSRITNDLIIEYLDINKGSYDKSIRYVKNLKKEINKYIKLATEHFSLVY